LEQAVRTDHDIDFALFKLIEDLLLVGGCLKTA